MTGLALLRFLIDSTGLPQESVEAELKKLILKHGFDTETLTLDQVREVMVEYLQDSLLEAKDHAG